MLCMPLGLVAAKQNTAAVAGAGHAARRRRAILGIVHGVQCVLAPQQQCLLHAWSTVSAATCANKYCARYIHPHPAHRACLIANLWDLRCVTW